VPLPAQVILHTAAAGQGRDGLPEQRYDTGDCGGVDADHREVQGAMFWTIDDDRREQYRYSNVVGPELHSYHAPATAKQPTAAKK